jgi:hypothetical protein
LGWRDPTSLRPCSSTTCAPAGTTPSRGASSSAIACSARPPSRAPPHRYAYAHHNPLVYTDPTGHDPWWNDPDFATPLNWGCGPYFPGCLFGLGPLNDLAWTLDAGFTPWLAGALGPRPAPGGPPLWMSHHGWEIHQNVLARLGDPRHVGPLAGTLLPTDLPPLLNAPVAQYYFDARYGNINVIQPMDLLPAGSQFRITLAVDRPAIISVGLVRDRNLPHLINRGNWIPLPPFLP